MYVGVYFGAQRIFVSCRGHTNLQLLDDNDFHRPVVRSGGLSEPTRVLSERQIALTERPTVCHTRIRDELSARNRQGDLNRIHLHPDPR